MVPSTGYLEYFDLLLYQNGFMLMFPGKDPKVVAEFSASDKLFNTLNDSAQWGIDMGIRTVGELNDVIASGRIQDMILVQESYMEQKIGDIAETIASDRRKKFVLSRSVFFRKNNVFSSVVHSDDGAWVKTTSNLTG